MTHLHRTLLLAAACATALPAAAARPCEHRRAEAPAIDLEGIARVEVEIGSDVLALRAGSPKLAVTLCASSADRLDQRNVEVTRSGDVLRIAAVGMGTQIEWFGVQTYNYANLDLALPKALPVALRVGSGDASVADRSEVALKLGSGDVAIEQVARLEADVGSGDLKATHVGRLALEVGSGDAVLEHVGDGARVGVGSGDAVLRNVGGQASLRVGSGDIAAVSVSGDVEIASVGSGDVALEDVDGHVRIESIGSGDVRLDGVTGDVRVSSKRDVEHVSTRRVRGKIIIDG